MGLPSSLMSYILLLLFCLLKVSNINSAKPLKEGDVLFGGKFPALYVIGDSLVDAGNNNNLDTLIKSNFPPYGSNFVGGKATGRFSDGKTIADFIAIYYGLPLAPAYMGLSEAQKNDIATGINYASASCGVFNDTGSLMGKCLSMSVQVNLFTETVEKNLKKKLKTPLELSNHMAESLFMIAIGVNDYVFFYRKGIDTNEFAQQLLRDYLVQFERLHKLGARKFFINNVKPLGCYPNIIANTTPRGSCDEELNRAISIFNAKLKESLSTMHKKLVGTSFLYSDYFNFMLALRAPSTKQASPNLSDKTSPCCPSVYDGGLITRCNSDSVACKVPDTHIFFDPFHPTQMANSIYANQCFEERTICNVVI